MKHLILTGCIALLLAVTGCGNANNQEGKMDSANQVTPPNPTDQGKVDTSWKSDSAMVDTSLSKRAKPLK